MKSALLILKTKMRVRLRPFLWRLKKCLDMCYDSISHPLNPCRASQTSELRLSCSSILYSVYVRRFLMFHCFFSGGPLLCQNKQGFWTIYGITSFGEGCGQRYGIYSKVPNYSQWIKSVIKG